MIQKYRFELFTAFVCLSFFLIQRETLLVASLDPDEIFSWNLGLGSIQNLFSEGLKHCQQFIYYLSLKIWLSIFPSNDYWLRIPSLLAGVGTIVALFSLAKRIFKENHLFPQTLILFLYPQFVFYSTYARPYAFLLLFASMNLYLLHRYFFGKDSSRKCLHLFLLTLVLTMFTHHIGVIYVVAVVVSLLISGKRIGNKFELMPYQLFFILYLIQFINQKKFLAGSVSWIEPLTLGQFPEFFFNNRLFFIFYLFPLLAVVFLALRKKNKIELPSDSFALFNMTLIGVFLIGIAVGSLLVTPLFTHRHFYILLPSIFILCVYGFEDLRNFKVFVLMGLFIYLIGGGHKLYIKQYELGGFADTKTFLRTLKDKVEVKDGFHCVLRGGTPLFFKPYSTQYYNVDICKKYSTNFEGSNVITIDLDKRNDYKIPSDYSSVYSYSNFTVYKKN